MTSRTLALLAAATLGIAGFASAQQTGQGIGQSSSAQPDRSAQTSSQTGSSSSSLSGSSSASSSQKIDDKEFVKQAASGGLYEVESSKHVQDKVKDPQIKQIAKMMEQNHKQANDELKRLARQANIEVPTSPQGQDKMMLSQLKDAEDEQLGQKYLQQQVQAHQKSIQLFQQAQTQVQDPQLKQFAEKTLPKLQEHLQHLQKIQGGAQPAGSSLQGSMNQGMDNLQHGADKAGDKIQSGMDKTSDKVNDTLDR